MPKIKHIRINDIRYDLSTTIRNVDGLQEELDKKTSEILEIQNDLDGVHGDLDGIHEDLDKKAEEILAIQNDLEGVHDDLDGIHEDLDKKSGEILKIQGDLGDIQDDIDTKYDDYMGIKRVVFKHEDDIEGLGHEIDDLKKEIDELPDGGGGGSVTEVVPVTLGGTGKTSVTANNFLVGNGQSTLQEKTPAQVLTLIGGASASEVEDLKTSVSDGKSAIASAITDKGVSTSGSDSFADMAAKIGEIELAPPDGKEFTKISSTLDGEGLCIVHGRNMFVLNTMHNLYYSKNGVDWDLASFTPNTVNPWADIRCLACNGEEFVALGHEYSFPMHSTSGSSWTTHSSPKLSFNVNAVAYGRGVFVAVGDSETGLIAPEGTLEWEATAFMSDAASRWNAITYGRGHFVAVGNNGAIVSSPTGNSFSLDALDGLSPSSRILPTDIEWYSVAYGNGIFIAVGKDNEGNLCIGRSTIGLIWTIERKEGLGNNYRRVTWGNGKFLLFGFTAKRTGSNQIMYSTDGSEWITVEKAIPSNTAIKGGTWGNGMFVCTGYDLIAYSRTTNDY